ncbi:MAG TPA: hydantoinase/oxoprolinase family protein [Solirubrobacterales bacterium]|jgi:N-methylhydantoinase A|nr:hydantoinase/oxoprolinase family protein [Solirubrobacterales bacterium]
MAYICGIDVGGTFTDCVIVDGEGAVTVAKSSSTPGDFAQGMLDALTVGAERLGIPADELLPQVSALFHGTTVATNAMVERKGVDSAMLLTAGHGDGLRIMRGAGRTAGLSPEEYLQISRASKPKPIVSRRGTIEIHERIDAKGQVVVELDEDDARAKIRALLDRGVRSVGICLLWSFRNPVHELRLREILQEEAGEKDVYTTLSHELIPKWGEYERGTGTAINGYIGPLVRDYLLDLKQKIGDRGMTGPILIMQAGGGLAEAGRVIDVAVQTIGSGPVAGVTGSSRFGQTVGQDNVICTDMGGTTFDVGLVVDGAPIRRASTILQQFEYSLPQVDVRSVGAGGGSIAWVDPVSKALRVGPQSAGANPGPAAYGKGGTEPTVTDANVVLGYIDPDNFLGGEMVLDAELARAAIGKLAAELGMETTELAAGIVQIVEAQMAELIRQMTVQSGYDPRDFVVYAYGGAGPTHGVGYAAELGARSVIVPLLDLGAVWSAYGVASSDLVELIERTDIMRRPFDLERLNSSLDDAAATGEKRLLEQGVDTDGVVIERRAQMRYTAQINEVDVILEPGQIDEAAAERMVADFERRYEQLYGKGSGFAGAGVEVVAVSAEARGRLAAQSAVRPLPAEKPSEPPRETGRREVFWPRERKAMESKIVAGDSLGPGHLVEGPAVIELPHTTIAVPPGYKAAVDELGDCVIDL